MKLRELLSGVSVLACTADMEMEISGVSYDSRSVRPGDLFVAMTGFAVDGHKFIAAAQEKGAAAALCQKEPGGTLPYVRTEDSRRALAIVGANWFGHPAKEMTMVAVTGTCGKTTTTYLLKAILEQAAGAKVGLIGTNQNMIGNAALPTDRTTPESFEVQKLFREMADAGCTHVVMEVSSHALVQHRVEGLEFSVGVFTNLTQDHLDYHGSMEAYRQAKGLLFRQCRKAVLNLDDPAGRWYGERVECPAFTYSENKDAACLTAKNIRLFPGHVEFEAVSREDIQRIHLPIPGGFTIYNALAAISCGLCLGLTLADIAASLRSAKGVRGRVEVVPVPTAYTVLIDYAHTPNALENVLLTARDFTAGRLICLFGCGGDRDRTKRPLMGGVVRELADVAVITSDNPRTEDPWAIIQDVLTGMGGPGGEVHVEPDRRQAIRWALAQGRSGDVIVLAGKGHETVQEVQGVTLPLDEREIVAEYFEKRAQCRERAGNLPAGVV